MATAQIGKPVRRVEDQKFITGAGRYNLINDRDFVASNVKYSF